MFTVRLTRVPENGVLAQEGVRLSPLDLGLGADFDPADVSASWELTRMLGKVFGKVSAESVLRLACGRCLKGFSRPTRAEFMVLFEPRAKVRPAGSGEARADEGKEGESDAGPSTVYFDGEELPLGEELRQELELTVPFSVLCREDCRGLCPRCGANLNDGPCRCSG